MPSLGNLFFKIGADVSEATKGIKKVGEELEKIKRISLFSAAIQGATAAVSVFKTITSAVTPLVDEFDRAAKSSEKLRVALKNNIVGVAELKAQANQLAGVRLFSSDQTVNSQALLGNLGLSAEAIKRLTPLIQDFASAQGIDLATATQLVGRAVATGSDSLKKYGISIGDAKSGSERFAIVQEGLIRLYAGHAEAAAKVGSGPLQLMVQRFSQIKEIAGESLLRFVGVFLPQTNKGIDEFAKVLAGLPAKAERFGQSIKNNFFVAGLAIKALNEAVKLSNKLFGTEAEPKAKSTNAFGLGNEERLKLIQERNSAAAVQKKLIEDLNKLGLAIDDTNKKKIISNESLASIDLAKLKLQEAIQQIEQLSSKSDSIFKGQSIRKAERLGGDANILRPVDLLPQRELKTGDISKQINLLSESYKSYKAQADRAAQASRDFTESFNDILRAGAEQTLFVLGEQLANIFSGGKAELRARIAEALAEGNESLAASLKIELDAKKFNFGAFLEPLANVLIDMGKLAIATGVAVLGIKKALESLNPYVALAAGVALVALGTFVRGKAAKAATAFAKGGLVFGPTFALVGDNPNARQDPEVISPLSKLHDLMRVEVIAVAKLMSVAFDKSLKTLLPETQAQPIYLPSSESVSPTIRHNTNLEFRPQVILVDGEFRLNGHDLIAAVDVNRAIQERHSGRRRNPFN